MLDSKASLVPNKLPENPILLLIDTSRRKKDTPFVAYIVQKARSLEAGG